jgi:protein SCO1/2
LAARPAPGPAAAPRPPPTATHRGVLVTPPLPKPTFTLTDTAGTPFDFRRQTQGYVTLLLFGYSHCPQECPLHLAQLALALAQLPPEVAERVKVVFVTTDPARDTPAVLRRWLDRFDRRFIGLTGDEAAITAAQRAAGLPPARKAARATADYEVEHASVVLAYTTDDRAHLLYPSGVIAADWVHDLPLLVDEAWSSR